jgi:hypothetical protein
MLGQVEKSVLPSETVFSDPFHTLLWLEYRSSTAWVILVRVLQRNGTNSRFYVKRCICQESAHRIMEAEKPS